MPDSNFSLYHTYESQYLTKIDTMQYSNNDLFWSIAGLYVVAKTDGNIYLKPSASISPSKTERDRAIEDDQLATAGLDEARQAYEIAVSGPTRKASTGRVGAACSSPVQKLTPARAAVIDDSGEPGKSA